MSELSAIAKQATRQPELLRKEIIPFGSAALRASGAAIIGNPDPVLSYLSTRGEETYRIMERETAIGNARQDVDNTILAAGSEVLVGDSRSAMAQALKDFAIDFLRRIPRWSEVQVAMLDAVYWGWRPLEMLWVPSTTSGGAVRWFVGAIVEKSPAHFRFTTDRDLVLLDPLGRGEPQVLNSPADWIRWLVCTSGSVDNPYGIALYQKVWLIWFAKQRFFQLWSQGMERSMGLVKLDRTGPEDMTKSAAEAWQEVRGEVQQIVKRLRETNVLVTMPGWKTELLTDVDFSTGWQGIIDYCDRQMAISVAGETLSFSEAEFGTRAQAQVHERTGEKAAKMRARRLEGWVNDGLLARALAVNFGEVDPDDVPKWRSKLGRGINLDAARFLLDYGAELDGTRIATDANVPLVTPDTPADDVVVLKKASPPPALVQPQPPRLTPNPPSGEPPPEGVPASRSAGDAESVAVELDQAASRLVTAASQAHGELWGRRLEAMVDRWLAEHPDPFDPPQPAGS